MRTLKTIFFVLYLVIICFETATPWWRRRRRRRYSPPPCDKSECIVSDWSARGSCSLRCGLKGYQLFERRVLVRQGSCGSCHYALTDWRPCNKEPWRCRNYSRQKNYGCICRGGWTGTCCELDLDECQNRPCQHICVNTRGSYTCKCRPCYYKVGTRCELRQCSINSQCYVYSQVNPRNQCQKCSSSYKTGWTNDTKLSCNDGRACTRNDRCYYGRCIGTPFTCLYCERCYNDACLVKPGYCTINFGGKKTCFWHKTRRPGHPCQECDSNNKHRWTSNNNLLCSDNNLKTKDDRCLNGVCVGTPYNCLPCESHDGSACQLRRHYCIIQQGSQRACFGRNQYKPGNPCQWCDPGSSTSTWTNRHDVACDDSDQCTRGDTCRSGQCTATPFTCNSVCQYCNGSGCSLKKGFGFANNKCMCNIAGRDYGHQTLNPSNECQWCDLYDTTTRTNGIWTNRPSLPCNDQDNCTKLDTCFDGRCLGQGYSCQSSYPSTSCIGVFECVGDGTCGYRVKSKGTICRPAVDICDKPERCDGVTAGCPAAVADNIILTDGKVQIIDSNLQSPSSHQFVTNKLFLEISGFFASCGEIHLSWFLLSGKSTCSSNSDSNGTLPNTDKLQVVTGLTLQDNQSYKVALKASGMRRKTYQLICSSAILIDTSKPQGGWVRDGPKADLSYQDSTLLQVNWGGFRTRYGVGKYQWKVLVSQLNSNQTSELVSFKDVYQKTSAAKTFSSIKDGSKVKFVVRAFTKAGLFSEIRSDGVIIDTSPPVTGKIYDGNQFGVDLKFARWTNSFTANWEKFIDPHSPLSRYTWAVQRQGAGLITTFKTTLLKRSFIATNLNLVSRQSYCAVVRGYNEAGIYTQSKSDCLVIDHDPPQAGIVHDGHLRDVDYQSEDNMIAANWNGFTDGYKGSGIVEYKYKVTDGSGSIIVPWTSSGNATRITRSGVALKNDTKYFVTVRAIDAVGLSTDVKSNGFLVDRTHPVFTGTVMVSGEGDAINGTPCVYIPSVSYVTVQWVGFSDAHSGLQRYEWSIITSDNSPSNYDFTEVSGTNLPTTATFHNLALSQGKGYYVIIRAYNGATLYKDAYSVLVIPDSTPPLSGNVFDGPSPYIDIDYQADLKHVFGSWSKFPEPQTAVKQYYYAVGSCMTGNYHITGNGFMKLDPPTATVFKLTNISLVHGQRYCLKIKAENKAGLLSAEVSSDGFIVDVTPPKTRNAKVRDGRTGFDIDYQDNTTAMSAEWEGFEDPESGIQYYEYGISRLRDEVISNISSRNTGTDNSATVNDLALTSEVYYFIVCAVNNVDIHQCRSSDGVLIDFSSPSHGVVHDGIIEPDLQYQASLSSIAANWEGIWDLESGIEKFEWSIGTSADDKGSVQEFTDVGLSTHVSSRDVLKLSTGRKYHVYLRVTNQAGAFRELASDGVIVDGSPPIPSTIYPAGFGLNDEWKYSYHENAFYSASASSISVYWKKFTEMESEVWYYKWAIGTSKCDTQVQPLVNIGRANYANTTRSDLVFRFGAKYYVTVISRNRAGLVSRSCSDGLVFDSTPPPPGDVIVGQSTSKNGKKTFISGGAVSISWVQFNDPESGIKRCNISILDQTGNVIFLETRSNSSGNITIPQSVVLSPGEYIARIECINNAYLASSASSLFVIDNTPPVQTGPFVVGVSRDASFHYQSDEKSITVSWPPFADLESGMEKYYVGIGTQQYLDNVVKLENAHLATRITKNDLSLSRANVYYITVIAINQAGLGTNVSSAGIIVDTSPPLAQHDAIKDGSGTEDIDFFSPAMELSAHWDNITDPESGIVQSEYCLGIKPHGCQIQPMTNIGREKSFILSEYSVQAGEKVYVTVKVTNGAGLSKTRISDGMLLDVSPPLMGDVIDGSHITGMDYNVVLEDWNVSTIWFGVEDGESGIDSCTWTIESDTGLKIYEQYITNNSIYGERKVLLLGQTYKDLHFSRNVTYYNVLTCLNRAKLQATVRSNGFEVKPIWPIPSAVRDGPIKGSDLVYLTNTKLVGVNWDSFVANNKDPVINYEFAIGTAPGMQDVLRFTSVGLKRSVEMDLAPGIPDLDVLKIGRTYFATIKAITSRGLTSIQHSDGFTVDASPPLQIELSVSHKVIDQSTKTIEITVSWDDVKDRESGIIGSGYCLGTTPGTCYRNFVSTGSSTFGMIGSFIPDWWIEYYVIVVVENGAGLRTVMSSKKLVFDTTPPSKGTVIDGIFHDVDFMTATSSVSIQWYGFEDKESGIASCLWSLIEQSVSENRSAFGNDTILLSEIVEIEGNFTRENLSLAPGARYVSEITCTNGDGFSSSSFSDGVIVDVTSPIAGLVHDGPSPLIDVEFQSSGVVVEAVWTHFEDQESGILEYRWGLGTTPDNVDIVNFMATGRETFGKKENVTLISGVRYYVTVEATNGAGMTSHGWSKGFTVDFSPPELTEVSAGELIWIGPPNNLRARWRTQDLQSGITKIEYCVGLSPVGCQIKSMTEIPVNLTKVTCTDCQLNHRETYYISIRVTNGAGLFAVTATNGTKADLTAPIIGDVVMQFSFVSCVTNCTLVANITSVQDDESGVRICRYAIRNSISFVTDFVDNKMNATIEAIGLRLPAGENNYVVVRCENLVGLSSEVTSSSVMVDNTPPSKGSVIVSKDRTHDVYGLHSSCHLYNKTLRAHWYGFNDSESGISGFRVAVGRQPNATDVLQFKDIGLTTSFAIRLTNSALVDGDIVYVTVESRNSAGLTTKSSSPATRIIAADNEEYLKEGDFYCLNV